MTDPTRLIDSLAASKQALVDRSSQLTSESRWDEAKRAIEWAKQIDGMIAALSNGNGLIHQPAVRRTATDTQSTRARRDLPYYYVEDEGDRLVKVGPSRDGGTYEHRVVRKNFELVLSRLRDMAGHTVEFETQRLVDRCDIPGHEPLIVVAVLEKHGLLIRLRRGRWQFADPAGFGRAADAVWQQLSRQ